MSSTALPGGAAAAAPGGTAAMLPPGVNAAAPMQDIMPPVRARKGVLGFLWRNAFPAEVFLGDTGSLAIGGAIAMMAFLLRQEMLFPIAGGLFVLEIFTSLVQEKIGTRLGRRLVLRAPFHHALAFRGIAEPKAVVRLWIVSLLLAAIALLSLKVR